MKKTHKNIHSMLNFFADVHGQKHRPDTTCFIYFFNNTERIFGQTRLIPLCLKTNANEIGRNEPGTSICTDINRSATD